MKKDSNNWKKYGFSFWVAFSVVAISLGLMGAVFAGFSAYTIVLGKGGIFWAGLFVFGLISLACAFFCFRLLPDWANMIRSFRLLDQRFKGAMGATSVSQYLQADEERNRALMESFEAKQNAIGHNLAERMNKLQSESEENSRQTNANIEQMTRTMKAFMDKMDRFTSPLELQQHRAEVQRLMEGASFIKMSNENKEIEDEQENANYDAFEYEQEDYGQEDYREDEADILDNEDREAPVGQDSTGFPGW